LADGLEKLDGFFFHAVELSVTAGVDASEPNLGGKVDEDGQIGIGVSDGELIDRVDFLGIDGASDALGKLW
jgi:hypothetical protein